jgi:hypothetical protein
MIFVAYFFGGAFLANSLPHLVCGTTGKPFPTPFASPPFRGPSPPVVNVAWGWLNLAVAYLLLMHVGEFDLRNWLHAAPCLAGFGLVALNFPRSLARIEDQAARSNASRSGSSSR